MHTMVWLVHYFKVVISYYDGNYSIIMLIFAELFHESYCVICLP
jgi:hypothetical protein